MKLKKFVCTFAIAMICLLTTIFSVGALPDGIYYNCDASNAGASTTIKTSNGGAATADASFVFGGVTSGDKMTTTLIR